MQNTHEIKTSHPEFSFALFLKNNTPTITIFYLVLMQNDSSVPRHQPLFFLDNYSLMCQKVNFCSFFKHFLPVQYYSNFVCPFQQNTAQSPACFIPSADSPTRHRHNMVLQRAAHFSCRYPLTVVSHAGCIKTKVLGNMCHFSVHLLHLPHQQLVLKVLFSFQGNEPVTHLHIQITCSTCIVPELILS